MFINNYTVIIFYSLPRSVSKGVTSTIGRLAANLFLDYKAVAKCMVNLTYDR